MNNLIVGIFQLIAQLKNSCNSYCTEFLIKKTVIFLNSHCFRIRFTNNKTKLIPEITKHIAVTHGSSASQGMQLHIGRNKHGTMHGRYMAVESPFYYTLLADHAFAEQLPYKETTISFPLILRICIFLSFQIVFVSLKQFVK